MSKRLSIVFSACCAISIAHAGDNLQFTPHPQLDLHGMIDVWALRDDVAFVEAYRAIDESDGCSGEGDGEGEGGLEPQQNLSTAQKNKLAAERSKAEKAAQLCIDNSRRKVERFQTLRSKFIGAWQPLINKAILQGDKVAEAILLNCDSTDLFDRENKISTCSEPTLAKRATERLEQIGFKPAIPYQVRLDQINKIAGKEQRQLALQELVFDYFRSAALGLDPNVLYQAANYWGGSDQKTNVRLAHNSALIQAALQEFPRAFSIGNTNADTNGAPGEALRRLALNRVIVKPALMTWGPALLSDDGRFKSNYFHHSSPFHFVECGNAALPRTGPNSQSACTNFIFGTPPPVFGNVIAAFNVVDPNFDTDLRNLIQQSERNIEATLRAEPRWAVFLINRANHHEWVPERRASGVQKIATDWVGNWQLIRSFQIRSRDQRFFKQALPDEKHLSAMLHIQSDNDTTSATITTQNRGALSPADVNNCPLRYSGSTTFFGGKFGFVENFVDNSNSAADVYPPDAFAPFDPKKKYKQVLLSCIGGEVPGSDQVRFLLLAENTLVEVSASGVANAVLTIRHYKRVTGTEAPLAIDSENF